MVPVPKDVDCVHTESRGQQRATATIVARQMLAIPSEGKEEDNTRYGGEQDDERCEVERVGHLMCPAKRRIKGPAMPMMRPRTA